MIEDLQKIQKDRELETLRDIIESIKNPADGESETSSDSHHLLQRINAKSKIHDGSERKRFSAMYFQEHVSAYAGRLIYAQIFFKVSNEHSSSFNKLDLSCRLEKGLYIESWLGLYQATTRSQRATYKNGSRILNSESNELYTKRTKREVNIIYFRGPDLLLLSLNISRT